MSEQQQPEGPSLSELLSELQAAAEELSSQLQGLRALGAQGPGDPRPTVQRLLELTPPELRGRIEAAATYGLTATRDLADWVLTQLAQPPVSPGEPEELLIEPLPAGEAPGDAPEPPAGGLHAP